MRRIIITIPIVPGGDVARLELSIPMTTARWEQMLSVLAAMKEGIVSEQEDEGVPEDTVRALPTSQAERSE